MKFNFEFFSENSIYPKISLKEKVRPTKIYARIKSLSFFSCFLLAFKIGKTAVWQKYPIDRVPAKIAGFSPYSFKYLLSNFLYFLYNQNQNQY